MTFRRPISHCGRLLYQTHLLGAFWNIGANVWYQTHERIMLFGYLGFGRAHFCFLSFFMLFRIRVLTGSPVGAVDLMYEATLHRLNISSWNNVELYQSEQDYSGWSIYRVVHTLEKMTYDCFTFTKIWTNRGKSKF